MRHFLSTSAFVAVSELRNRARRSMKHPRYLVSALVGVLYFSWSSGCRVGPHPFRSVAAVSTPGHGGYYPSHVVLLLVSLTAFLYLAAVWVEGDDRPAIVFTREEAQFFLVAPVSARALLQDRALRTVARAALAAASVTLVGGRYANPFFVYIGLWCLFSTLALHRVGASLVRARFRSIARGGGFLTFAGLALLGGRELYRFIAAVPQSSLRDPSVWLDSFLNASGPHSELVWWVMTPIIAMIGPLAAKDWRAFGVTLPAALCLLVAHYLWVTNMTVSVDEMPIMGAAVARRRTATARPLLRLWPRRIPWLAIAWKNDIASRRDFSRLGPLFICSLLVLTSGAAPALITGHTSASESATAVGLMAVILALAIAVFGPHIHKGDFRSDISQLDLLRSFPLTSRQVVAGELAAPLLRMTLLECVLLFFGGADVLVWHRGQSGLICACAFAGAIMLPAATAAGVFSRNAMVLLFPRWAYTRGNPSSGIGEFGGRIISTVGSTVIGLVALTPLLLVAGALTLCLWAGLGCNALYVSGVVVGALSVALSCIGTRILASLFESL